MSNVVRASPCPTVQASQREKLPSKALSSHPTMAAYSTQARDMLRNRGAVHVCMCVCVCVCVGEKDGINFQSRGTENEKTDGTICY